MIADEAAARDWLREELHVDAGAFDRLQLLVNLLTAETEKQNLVSRSSLQEVWRRHICDSAQLLRHVPRGTTPWLDLGTGAGFPGLVVAALRPEVEVVLVETRARRVDWLRRAIAALALEKVTVAGQHLETVQAFKVGVISARAFAPLDKLLTLAARFSTSATIWLLPKGQSAAQELESLKGWRHMFHVEQSMTDPAAGVIVGTLAGRSA